MPMRGVVGGVRAAAVPQAAVPDQHRALAASRPRSSRSGAVVGGVVGEVRAGHEPGRAVRLGEVGERPHRVAHGRRVRLRDRDQLVVGVDRLRGLAGQDRDRRQRRDQAARVEHALDDRQHVLGAPGRARRARRTRAGCRRGACGGPRTSCGAAATSKNRSSRRGRRRARRRARARSRPRRSCSPARRLCACTCCSDRRSRRPSPREQATSAAMALYALGDIVPQIDPDAFVHPDARSSATS